MSTPAQLLPNPNKEFNSPIFGIDIQQIVTRLRRENSVQNTDRGRLLFKTNELSITITTLKDGEIIEDEFSQGFVTLQVIKGQLQISLLNTNVKLLPGQMVVLRPNIEYNIIANDDSAFLSTSYM